MLVRSEVFVQRVEEIGLLEANVGTRIPQAGTEQQYIRARGDLHSQQQRASLVHYSARHGEQVLRRHPLEALQLLYTRLRLTIEGSAGCKQSLRRADSIFAGLSLLYSAVMLR